MLKPILKLITLFYVVIFFACETQNEEFIKELKIEEKVSLLEGSEWLLKGFEDRVMHTFSNGKHFTFYGTDDVFSDEALPAPANYAISGDLLTIDFHFGHIYNYDLKFSCENTTVEFYKDGELNKTLYKRNSNYKQCQ